MSISTTLLQRLVDRRALVFIEPLRYSVALRHVLALPEAANDMDPEHCVNVRRSDMAPLRAWVDGFIGGRYVSVGTRRSRRADLKILEPRVDSIWELGKQQKPGTRLFGRFARKDVFVVTSIRTSQQLYEQSSQDATAERYPIWDEQIALCKAEWQRLFGDQSPVTGGDMHDYLTKYNLADNFQLNLD